MDFETDTYDNVDSENEYSEGEVDLSEDLVDFVLDVDTEHSENEETAAEEYPYEALSTEELVQRMDDHISEVNSVIGVSATTTRILLNHFKWNQEKLIERFYDDGQDKLFSEARVVNSSKELNINATTVQPRKTDKGTEECEICFMVQPCLQMTGLKCGHRFCTHCWSVYLTAKIMEEGVAQTIACQRCDIFVDDESVMRLVSDSEVLLKYQHLITNGFVECNRLLRWCPSPNCGNAIKVLYVDSRPVTCKCGHVFCFSCGEDGHDPIKCTLLKKWIKKCNDDSETGNWLAVNTKECPKCKATIEKDGGCNHMSCRRTSCLYEFCWLCLGRWSGHSDEGCNRYDDDEAKAAHDVQTKSRAALNRYLFYYDRYTNHQQSLKFEHKLYASVETKMQEMQQNNMNWMEVQFLKKAVDILCKCRQTLMYTYVFAYYLEKNNQSLMFEANQRDLENAVETLSEYLERDITSAELTDIQLKVQNKYRYCQKRSLVLLKHVHEGYEKKWWKYNA